MPLDGHVTDFQPAVEDVLTLPRLIAWLEQQDPDTEYDFYDCGGKCLIGLFYGGKESRPFGPYMDWGAVPQPYEGIAVREPWTFGAALTRAREAAGS